MIQIGNYPILWHIMKGYAKWGFEDFVLCLGYRSQVIKDFFFNYDMRVSDVKMTLGNAPNIKYLNNRDNNNWKVTLAETGVHTMTGARVFRVRRYLDDDESFMLTYGDGVSDINIRALVDFHLAHRRVMTVTGVRPPGRFGELEIDGDRAVGFNEKPQATEGRISGGFFVCNRRLFDYLSDDEGLMLEQEPIRRIVSEGELMVYRHDGFWHPMDTYRDYNLLNSLWEKGEARGRSGKPEGVRIFLW